MNRLIFQSHQRQNNRLTITGRQYDHIKNILKLNTGDSISIGEVNGNIGNGKITEFHVDVVHIEIESLTTSPPAQLPVTLVLALPRPQMIKRILQTVACIGVKKLILIQSSRVEKSFWQSPCLYEDQILTQLILGLEQGGGTQLPEVVFFNRFRPFMEDTLTSVSEGTQKVIADASGETNFKLVNKSHPTTIAIGPEGGFLDQEVRMFIDVGFEKCQLGERILKVETAIPAIIGKLFF